MTGLAAVRCSDMVDHLAGGDTAVMAGETGTDYLGVIHLAGRLEGRSHVAALALRAGKNMRQVLAGGDTAVMAGGTGADYLRVIHLAGRLEDRCHMTTFTGIAGLYMRGALAGRCRAVVAAKTIRRNAIMTEMNRLPCKG